MSYFEESFFLDEDIPMEDWDVGQSPVPPGGSESSILKPSSSVTVPSSNKLSKSPSKQTSMLSYMKSVATSKATSTATSTTQSGNSADMMGCDWLDDDMDELWEDEDASAPWPKKQKTEF